MPHAVQRLPISCGSSLGNVKMPSATGTCAITCSILRRFPPRVRGGKIVGHPHRELGLAALAERGDAFARVGRGRGREQQRGIDAMRLGRRRDRVVMRHTSWRVSATETGAVPRTSSRA